MKFKVLSQKERKKIIFIISSNNNTYHFLAMFALERDEICLQSDSNDYYIYNLTVNE